MIIFTQNARARADSVCRWRHRKSEAHLVTEGMPSNEELRLVKKMAQYYLKKALARAVSS
jgi:EAL domain-containing protein (putative c-di-GMP-specific phosphodiesterase class I)